MGRSLPVDSQNRLGEAKSAMMICPHDLRQRHRLSPCAVTLSLLGCLCWGCQQAPPSPETPSRVGANPQVVSENPSRLFPPGFDPGSYPELQHLYRVTDQIYSGAEPEDEAAFQALKRLGIRTIVSVDGALPEVQLAEKYGLEYVHLPFGYDSIPAETSAGLTRVVRDKPGPLYIHCHHGQHRGPAAVAIACIAAGSADNHEALAILKVAGTGENYRGLWRDVEQFQPPPQGAQLPELVSASPVDPLASAMAQISRSNDQLKELAERNWQIHPGQAPLVPAQELAVIMQGFREAVRLLDADRTEELITWLKESEQLSDRMTQQASQTASVDPASWQRLQTLCKECHRKYRDH